MINIEKGDWAAALPQTSASAPAQLGCTDETYANHAALMAFAQPGTLSHGLCGKSLDTVRLTQRLGSLLFDIQSGSDQFESLWDRWYAPEDTQDSLPFGVLDKPQTAAPPVTPPMDICDYIDSEFSQSVQMNPPQTSQGVETDALLEESAQKFDAMAVGNRNIPARF